MSRISGRGLSQAGMNAIRYLPDCGTARIAISCFHDTLLAVAKGILTAEQVKDFFWQSDLDQAEFFSEFIYFSTNKNTDEQ